MNIKDYILITDIDNTLTGDDESLAGLKDLLMEHRGRLGFGLASGRSLERTVEVLDRYEIENVDVIISSVGTEVYYGNDHQPDREWECEINQSWNGDVIREVISRSECLELQTEEGSQRALKISYNLIDNASPAEVLKRIAEPLKEAGQLCNYIFSHGIFLDVLPLRASKGKAIKYISGKYGIPLERIAAAGDSGNDRDMLTVGTSGIVVGNYDNDLADLKGTDAGIYFARDRYAAGIIEGLKHHRFL